MGKSSDTIVAARVPEEIKNQGNLILAKLGYTQTHLINSAYRYVLEFHRLPFESATPKPGKRTLDSKRMRQLSSELMALQVSTYDYSLGNTRTLKDVLAEKRGAEYKAQV